ncbi:MAG: retroviral-like aspartic protease family protein [archaeon GB-1867-035]|nr:retroviral-like aspartic protease family protein [Candidatus Culexmicrobium profundum]
MDVFKVKAKIWNPFNPQNKVEVNLIVDTDATYTVIPSKLLRKLNVKPTRKITVRLADNRVSIKPLGEIGIEIQGYKATATPVIFGEENIYLLGSVTMEQLSLTPDPIHKKLKPTEALLMKNKIP